MFVARVLGILESYSKDCFKFFDNFLRMSFPSAILNKDLFTDTDSKNDKTIGGQIGCQIGGQIGCQIGGQIIDLTERQKAVLECIIADPKISRSQLSEKLGVNESAIQKHLEVLKKKRVIEREGKTKGSWKINKIEE